jgi:hypothetical protein
MDSDRASTWVSSSTLAASWAVASCARAAARCASAALRACASRALLLPAGDGGQGLAVLEGPGPQFAQAGRVLGLAPLHQGGGLGPAGRAGQDLRLPVVHDLDQGPEEHRLHEQEQAGDQDHDEDQRRRGPASWGRGRESMKLLGASLPLAIMIPSCQVDAITSGNTDSSRGLISMY